MQNWLTKLILKSVFSWITALSNKLKSLFTKTILLIHHMTKQLSKLFLQNRWCVMFCITPTKIFVRGYFMVKFSPYSFQSYLKRILQWVFSWEFLCYSTYFSQNLCKSVSAYRSCNWLLWSFTVKVWDAWREFVPLAQFKTREKQPLRSVTFMFLKLYKWYQITQSITYEPISRRCAISIPPENVRKPLLFWRFQWV